MSAFRLLSPAMEQQAFAVPLSGLGGDWEHTPVIRRRVRETGSLFMAEVGGKPLEINIRGAEAHGDVLEPLLKLLLDDQLDIRMCSIPALEEECLASSNPSEFCGNQVIRFGAGRS